MFFLKGTEFRSGKINYLGKTELHGRNCYKLKFSYRDNKLFYERYVDLETGKILATKMSEELSFISVEKFFLVAFVFQKRWSYKERMHLNTINFERIMVNAAMKEETLLELTNPRTTMLIFVMTSTSPRSPRCLFCALG